MRILQQYDKSELPRVDDLLIHLVDRGEKLSWQRVFILQNPEDEKVAFVAFNIFERMAWSFQEFLGRPYAKLESVFSSRRITLLTPTQLYAAGDEVRLAAIRPASPASARAPDAPPLSFEELMRSGELDQAVLKLRELLIPYKERVGHLAEIAKAYLERGEVEKGMTILTREVIDREITYPIYESVAYSYCLKGDYANAVRLVREISYDGQVQATLFAKAAEELFGKREFAKAAETAGQGDPSLKYGAEAMYLKVAQAYIDQDKLVESKEILNKIIYQHENRDKLRALLAQKFYAKKDFKNALSCNYFNPDMGNGKLLDLRIAQDCHTVGQTEEAFNVLGRWLNLLDFTHRTIASKYMAAGNFTQALDVFMRAPASTSIW